MNPEQIRLLNEINATDTSPESRLVAGINVIVASIRSGELEQVLKGVQNNDYLDGIIDNLPESVSEDSKLAILLCNSELLKEGSKARLAIDELCKILKGGKSELIDSLKRNSLDLAECNLKEIPEGVSYLDEIKRVNLSDNQIEDISSFSWPRSLEMMNLSGNKIRDLSKVKWPEGVINLQLSRNGISSVEGIEWPPNLRNIQLHNNEITDLSGLKLPNTVVNLGLSNNNIDSVADTNWPSSLGYLNLSNNRISSISSVGWPDSLQKINLSANRLVDLRGMSFPDKLNELALDGNIDLYDNYDDFKDAMQLPSNLKTLILDADFQDTDFEEKVPEECEVEYL